MKAGGYQQEQEIPLQDHLPTQHPILSASVLVLPQDSAGGGAGESGAERPPSSRAGGGRWPELKTRVKGWRHFDLVVESGISLQATGE